MGDQNPPVAKQGEGGGFRFAFQILFCIVALATNAAAGFYIFGVAFNGPITTAEIVRIQVAVAIPIGLIWGLILRGPGIAFSAFCALPFTGFLGIFVIGAMEKSSGSDVVRCGLIASMPLVLEVGACWATVRIVHRGHKRWRKLID